MVCFEQKIKERFAWFAYWSSQFAEIFFKKRKRRGLKSYKTKLLKIGQDIQPAEIEV